MKLPLKRLHTTAVTEARLDRTVQQLTGLSRAGVRGLLDHGCVSINGALSSAPQATVNPGDAVSVQYDPYRRYKETPKPEPDPAYKILFEDDHLIVVDKSAHILTVPTASGKGKTLVDALERHINRGKPASLWKRLHVVHRLDQGVSGVLVIAKSASVASKLKDQFAAHKPNRAYIAIVNGKMERDRGTFRSHLATDYSLNRYSTRKPGHGELAITHFEVMSHSRDTTAVRVELETGRRNQIRVHFAEAGHPVLGDPRYPRQLREADPATAVTSSHPKWRAKRLALHAASLEFTHPASGKTMRFEADLPTEFHPFVR